MLLAERIKALSRIPHKERTNDEKKELRKLNDLRRKGNKSQDRYAADIIHAIIHSQKAKLYQFKAQ